jgi:hypothetical protein
MIVIKRLNAFATHATKNIMNDVSGLWLRRSSDADNRSSTSYTEEHLLGSIKSLCVCLAVLRDDEGTYM